MAGFTRATAMAYIDDSVGTANRTAPTTPMKLSPETVAGTAAAAGTELGSTTRPSIVFVAATNVDPPVGANSAQVTVVAGANGTVVAIAIFDSAGTPIRKWYGPLASSRTLVSGDALIFAAAAVTLSITSP